MNNVDKQYLALMREILERGNHKSSRAGDTLSLFGKTLEFDLQEGFPLLTTRKVPYKGMIHELIWFLHGNTNIKYLVDNNVHIWDDDAYRWFKSIDFKRFKVEDPECIEGMYKLDHCVFELDELTCGYSLYDPKDNIVLEYHTDESFKEISKEQFIYFVKKGIELRRDFIYEGRKVVFDKHIYTFGDLGDIYGKQWRRFGISEKDQIQTIIDTLKTNPDDRRMLCVAFNPDVEKDVALPPCHVMFQFYTRELSFQERFTWLQENGDNKYDEWKTTTEETLDKLTVPKRELSLSFSMRSTDIPLGLVWNISSYSLLCHIMANICNMTVGKVIYFGGDVHIYANQIEGCQEQINREGYNRLPKLIIKRKINDIDTVSFNDFEIKDYLADAPIKFPLSVG